MDHEVLHQRMCEVILQWRKFVSDCKNNIAIQSTEGDIILDNQIKTHDSWVAKVEFLQGIGLKRAQEAMSLIQKDINIVHADIGNPSEVITHDTGRAMGLYLTDTFKPCGLCPGKRKKGQSKQKNCQMLQNFGRKAVLQHQLHQLPLLDVRSIGY